MEIPDQLVTTLELRRNTGERGTRIFTALRGVVYDVSDCPRWHTGLHEQLHFAGQDLSSEFGEAPHSDLVFGHPGVKIVGRLIDGGQIRDRASGRRALSGSGRQLGRR